MKQRISIMILFLLSLSPSMVLAVATEQPLLQSEDITYLGEIHFPAAFSMSYGGRAIAVSPDGTKIYFGGGSQNLGEATIPPIGGIGTTVVAPKQIPTSTGCNADLLGGAMVYNNRIIVGESAWYCTQGWTGYTHLACSTDINNCTAMQRVGTDYIQYYTGYMGLIPLEWQSLLGGPAFTGNSTMSIASQCSNGPSFFVFDPDDVVGGGSSVSANGLMYYPLSNPLHDPYVTNDLFTLADQDSAGVVFVPGTRSVLFFSKHGYGTPKYKQPGDPCDPDQGGQEAYPYRHQVTAFDANDLLAVKNGTKNPWDVQPYAWWSVDPQETCSKYSSGGIAYDPNTRRIYAAPAQGSGGTPTVYVYQVADVSGSDATSPHAPVGLLVR